MAAIRKRNDKWQVQIRRAGQRSISRSFNHRKDAAKWANQMEAKADQYDLPKDSSQLKRITVGDLVDRYLAEITPKKKSANAEGYVLRAFKQHPVTSKSLQALTQRDFANYRDSRLKEIRSSSLRRELNPIRHMFEVARDDWGIPISENPLAKLKLKATDNRRERQLKDGELDRLLEAGQTLTNPYVIPVILFALETAMRRGEILSLRLCGSSRPESLLSDHPRGEERVLTDYPS